MFRQALARVGSGGGQSNHFAIRLKFCAVAFQGSRSGKAHQQSNAIERQQ